MSGKIKESELHQSMKDRLNGFDNQIGVLQSDLSGANAQLAQKVSYDKARLKEVKLGQLDMTEEFLQQMAGATPINAVPADGSITPIKTSFFKSGKNLFNKATATQGYYVNYGTGVLTANASYYASDYIPVSSNTAYYRNFAHQMAFYDSNKTFISGVNTGNAITTPANCAFVRVTVQTINTFQFELGSVGTSYEAYGLFIDLPSILKDKSIQSNMIADGAIASDKVGFLTIGKNLFNKDTTTSGYYVSNSTGNLAANANYYASDYIPVSPNTVYTQSYGGYMAFYDASKTYISGLTLVAGVRSFTTPSGTAFIRVSCPVANLSNYQVEIGSISTIFEPYGIKLVNSLAEKTMARDTISLFLPSEICIAVGRTIELYNKQVALCGNINNFHFQWICNIGKSLKRKWSCTGVTEKIGNYTLTCNVYDNNQKLVATASTTVKVVSATISTPRNILTIGDSLSNNKAWLGELRSLSGNQYTLVGTRGTAPLKHEGRSGFTAGNYLAGTPYTFESEGVHPFWDGTRFNWNHYKTNNGISPDAVQIYLGTNGIAVDPTTNAGNIKQIVDYIRQDDANIPVFVVFTLYRGNQDGIGNQLSTDGYSAGSGVWKYEEDIKVYNLMTKLYSLLSAYTNLYFVPISLTHDSEYNFGAVSTPVNTRATQTESLPSEATHPQTQGYYQMADIMFSTFVAH